MQRERRLADRAPGDVRHRPRRVARSPAARYGQRDHDRRAGRPAPRPAASSARASHVSRAAQAAAVDRHPARGERLLQHRARHRRGGEPAVVVALRVVDLDDDHELRVVGGKDRRERGRVLPADVAPVLEPDRGAGLPEHRVVRELRQLAGAALPHRLAQELTQLRRDVGGHHPPHRLGLVPVEQGARRVPHLAHQRRRQQDAVVRDGAVRRRELHGVTANS